MESIQDLATYKSSLTGTLRDVNLLFLLRDDEILLAMKKRGFGAGRWNGVGGKLEPGETIEEATIREAQEEIGIIANQSDLQKVAVLDFYFPLMPEDKAWNQRVHVFIIHRWQNPPTESEEMRPQWFKQTALPFQDMWPDDSEWLPQVLAGKFITASFLFGENDTILDQEIIEKIR